MTPQAVGLLVEKYICSTLSQSDKETLDQAYIYLYNDGLIECEEDYDFEDRVYVITDRGRMFMKMLLNTSLPEHVWVNPDTGKVINP